MDKRAYYQRRDVVDAYEDFRFGSAGGRYVDALEKATMLELLADVDRNARVLDIPCGTGRLLRSLTEGGFRSLTGADSSQAMLDRSREAARGIALHLEDAFATRFADGSFDVVCSLRFLFHVDDAARWFAEMSRVLAPGGRLVFDSLRWTPRGLVPPVDRALGGRLFCYREPKLEALLGSHGFRILRTKRTFVLPSLLYRYLPDSLIDWARQLDARAPRFALTKIFVSAIKT